MHHLRCVGPLLNFSYCNMTQENTLLLNIARNLRYKTFTPMLGKRVKISERTSITTEVAWFVAQFADSCSFYGPEQKYLDGQIAKYGLLDMQFTARSTMLDADSKKGIPLLRELGFIDGNTQDLIEELGGDSASCLEELRDGIVENKTYLMLFLESSNPNMAEMSMRDRMARVYDPAKIRFPIVFTVADACVTNSSFVWMNKHFYI